MVYPLPAVLEGVVATVCNGRTLAAGGRSRQALAVIQPLKASLPTRRKARNRAMTFIWEIEALQEVLEKLRNSQLPSIEKKLGWVPSCDAGEQCAVRKGARIGRLCNCPRRTSCNLYILKCL
ncbi:cocaine- and amphetamine-regulated transcript protein-like [Hemicordylus capensis]|uniref:cocaine- and amphetamine-regulated transcript protein-like n=1 Tax=Hemicordylus capensis TaxID=884348 RepID=UPI002304935A|nr:cocaine- and amphetamine-regulated transcript protein-like [Hemicordylus capensis]